MNTILRKDMTPVRTTTPPEAALILGLAAAFSAAKQPFSTEIRDFNQLSDLKMEKSCSMRKLISEGFSAIPRAVLNNQDNPDEQERLIANLLFIFFRDARFKDGTMAIKKSIYPCRRGQLIISQTILAAQLKVNFRINRPNRRSCPAMCTRSTCGRCFRIRTTINQNKTNTVQIKQFALLNQSV